MVESGHGVRARQIAQKPDQHPVKFISRPYKKSVYVLCTLCIRVVCVYRNSVAWFRMFYRCSIFVIFFLKNEMYGIDTKLQKKVTTMRFFSKYKKRSNYTFVP
jgi:hypothetical protein